MPTSYRIDRQQRLVITTAVDTFNLADGLAHQEKLAQDPDFDPNFSQIMDFTRVNAVGLKADVQNYQAGRHVSAQVPHALRLG